MTQTTADIIQLISQGWTADIIGLEIWDHPVQLSQWLSQLRLTSADSSRRTGDCCTILHELLGAGLVPRLQKCNKVKSETVRPLLPDIITYYIILLHSPLLRIITFYIFTLFLHCFYALLHSLVLCILTKSLLRIITTLLQYYNIITI